MLICVFYTWKKLKAVQEYFIQYGPLLLEQPTLK